MIDLEKTVKIQIGGNLIGVIEVRGVVKKVSGYNSGLTIGLNSPEGALFKFEGNSPVRKGDEIRAGLIINLENIAQSFVKNALYLEIKGESGRIDYMKGYDPLHVDAIKLGID